MTVRLSDERAGRVRYNIFVPLLRGRSLAYNSMSGSLAVWGGDGAGSSASATRPGRRRGHHVRQLVYGGPGANGTDELAALEQSTCHRSTATAAAHHRAELACNFGCDYCFQGRTSPMTR